jgi:hypothetical protein
MLTSASFYTTDALAGRNGSGNLLGGGLQFSKVIEILSMQNLFTHWLKIKFGSHLGVP